MMKEIESSEKEIAEGMALDWKTVSAEPRRELLGDYPAWRLEAALSTNFVCKPAT